LKLTARYSDPVSELNLILFGPPGAGKGTQADRLQGDFQLPYIATGNMLRENVEEGTDLGKEAKRYMDNGDLVPDEVIVKMVAERLQEADAQDGFILDGFPRTVPQAEALDRMLEEKGLALDAVIDLKVDEDALLGRIESRIASMTANGETLRADDNPESLKKRLGAYRAQTAPLAGYYAGKGVLRPVDGMASIDDVTAAIAEVLKQASTGRPVTPRTAAARHIVERRSARWPLPTRSGAKKPAAVAVDRTAAGKTSARTKKPGPGG
jgi:adenylate kinase